MKKVILAGWALALVALILPLNSLGKAVSEHIEGEQSLSLTFSSLEAEIPIFGEVTVQEAHLVITWTGKGNRVVTPSDRRNQHAKIEDASGTITLIGVQSSVLGDIVFPMLVFEVLNIESGNINEHGVGEDVDLSALDLFFRAKSAEIKVVVLEQVLEFEFPPLGHTLVKIKDGKLQILKSEGLDDLMETEDPGETEGSEGSGESLLAPRRSKVCITTFGKIKSE